MQNSITSNGSFLLVNFTAMLSSEVVLRGLSWTPFSFNSKKIFFSAIILVYVYFIFFFGRLVFSFFYLVFYLHHFILYLLGVYLYQKKLVDYTKVESKIHTLRVDKNAGHRRKRIVDFEHKINNG
jgi:Ca2+/Na+ antiporter